MMDVGMVNLLGDKELVATLNALPDHLFRRVVRGMTSKMATPVVAATRKHVKQMTGGRSYRLVGMLKGKSKQERAVIRKEHRGIGLAANITKITKLYGRGSVTTVVGGKRPGGTHFHLVEYGHRMVTHSGRVVGFVPGKSMMRQAYAETKGTALNIAKRALEKGIAREAAKLAKLRTA